MIRYALSCADGHTFDSWFASADAYDSLAAAGHLSCAICGSPDVSKRLMAPAVGTEAPRESAADAPPRLGTPRSEMEAALAELRRKVETQSDYVGLSFAAEARAMHDGIKPRRPIYGEAKLEDARSLLEDGIPVAPLPFRPKAKSN
ncbi:DUF1178 family protein [Pseudoroseicyclus tamaricis]|uniref:DUF1178 family protein n=1 Tax=Pseudoroseicyclus tamaricis TaxID=2705421 RepID=A0A6B2K1M3_9RHOB|nr:DUF1178 family protein [Pseudoroseicyclus tamaricis]NDV01642.1 DUF1178 family protein [Pseudoroseicyclus tamaricis]